MFWLLVTGTGRCGTGYVAQVLNSMGVKCTHEGVFNTVYSHEKLRYQIDNGEYQAESSWMLAPYLNLYELKDMVVVHVVRDPKKVIDSQMRLMTFEREDDPHYKWLLKWLPELEGMTPLGRAEYFYLHWNAMIEPFATLRWRVEDDIRGLLDALNIEYEGKSMFDDTNYNSRVGYVESDVNPSPLVKILGRKYGYSCNYNHHG